MIDNEINGISIDETWTKFKEVIDEGVRRFIPLAGAKSTRKTMIPRTIRSVIKQRNKLWRLYRLTNRERDWENFKTVRNQVRSRLRVWEEDTEREMIRQFKGDKKKFYGYVKSKQKVRTTIGYVRTTDGILTTTEQETAQVLNRFFHSVFVNEGDYEPVDGSRVDSEVADVDITEEKVMSMLEKLKEGKSPRPDAISPKLLRECKETLCYPLTKIFEKSLKEARLPSDWKLANVTPIHKGGDKTEPSNFRPVSLTSVPCKIMESIVFGQVKEHLTRNKVPNDIQHGFTAGRSCLTNLLVSLEEWTKAIDEECAVDIINLNISKAFDSVPHKRLINKMNWYGLRGNVLGWLTDFLLERRMRVCVKGSCSDWCSVTSSVPQGSVGGPTQFSLYIDDMVDGIDSRMIQFADDTKMWRRIHDRGDNLKLQEDLDRLCEWSDEWKLKFNTKNVKYCMLDLGITNLAI